MPAKKRTKKKRKTAIQEVRLLKARVTRLRELNARVALLESHNLRLLSWCERAERDRKLIVDSILGIDSSRPGLSVSEAAKRSGRSAGQIYAMMRRTGIAGALDIGGRIRIPEEAVRHIREASTWPWKSVSRGG